ncbi:unnamed protein product [Rotaria magnacalcarata]
MNRLPELLISTVLYKDSGERKRTAWPLGATMVGIHPRPGREKIASKHVAHVLNDETQRKYIQAVKRLVSRAQRLFPNDPSRCVDYGQRNDNVTIIPSAHH